MALPQINQSKTNGVRVDDGVHPLEAVAKLLSSFGQGGDSKLAFINTREEQMLKKAGGAAKPHPLMPSIKQYYDASDGGDGGDKEGGVSASAGEHSGLSSADESNDRDADPVEHTATVSENDPTVDQEASTVKDQTVGETVLGTLLDAISGITGPVSGGIISMGREAMDAPQGLVGALKDAIGGAIKDAIGIDHSGTGGRNIGSSGETVSSGSKDPGSSGGGPGDKGIGGDNSIIEDGEDYQGSGKTADDGKQPPDEKKPPTIFDVFNQNIQNARDKTGKFEFFKLPKLGEGIDDGSSGQQSDNVVDPLKPSGQSLQPMQQQSPSARAAADPNTIPMHVDDLPFPLLALLQSSDRYGGGAS